MQSAFVAVLAMEDQSVIADLTEKLAQHPDITVALHISVAEDFVGTVLNIQANPAQRRIIFIDAMMLTAHPSFLRRLKEYGVRCNAILIHHQPESALLLRAMRSGIEDYLPLPLTEPALDDVLQRLQNNVYHADATVPAEVVEASRYLFWRNDYRKLNSTRLTLAQVNRDYGTHFSEGLYRAIFVELSSSDNALHVIDNQDMLNEILRMSTGIFGRDAYDMLYNRHSNGVSILINYPASKRNSFSQLFDQFFFQLRRDFNPRYHVETTMSIGRVYSDIVNLPEAKQEILDARWARKQLGSGRIIHAENLQSQPLSAEQKREINEYRDLIIHYYELLDAKQAVQCLGRFYDTYQRVLPLRQLRSFSRELMDFLFQNYNEELQSYGFPEELRHHYINREATAKSVESFQQVIIENNLDLMQKIESIVRRQYSQPIKDCFAYIALHHCSNIRLEDLAASVHLTPQYLSSRFHKETGRTISEYISDQKMNLARSMLTHSDKNISEIADYLGFADAHYFSKFFKARQQITPSKYRTIEQAKAKNNTT